MGEHSFQLEQGGLIVAEVSAVSREDALREIMHYAAVYSQDGPVKILGVTPEDWQAMQNLSNQ